MFGFCVSRPRNIGPNAWRVHWQVWCMGETRHGEKEVFAPTKHDAELSAVVDADDALAALEAELKIELPDEPEAVARKPHGCTQETARTATYKLGEMMP